MGSESGMAATGNNMAGSTVGEMCWDMDNNVVRGSHGLVGSHGMWCVL